MTFDVLEDVNFLAALVAAVVWFVAGAIWYSAFGTIWAAAGGIQMPSEGFRPNPVIFAGTFVLYLVTSIAMAMLAEATGSSDVGDGIVLGVVTGIGFAMALIAVGTIYDRKPKPAAWFALNGVFNLIAFVVVGAIVSAWD
jgi:hypothetical protein